MAQNGEGSVEDVELSKSSWVRGLYYTLSNQEKRSYLSEERVAKRQTCKQQERIAAIDERKVPVKTVLFRIDLTSLEGGAVLMQERRKSQNQ